MSLLKSNNHKPSEKKLFLISVLWSFIWPKCSHPEQARSTAQTRLLFAGALACSCFAVIGAKAFHLATTTNSNDTEVHVKQAGADRGPIYDRNGRVLAQTLPR